MKIKGQMSFVDEIIVDNFAGGMSSDGIAVVKANMPEWDEVVITNMAGFADYVAARA